jgi:hypothetical protein
VFSRFLCKLITVQCVKEVDVGFGEGLPIIGSAPFDPENFYLLTLYDLTQHMPHPHPTLDQF